MRRRWIILVFLLASMTGCSWSDCLFAAFSDAYSGGGTSWSDKRSDFDQRMMQAEEIAAKHE